MGLGKEPKATLYCCRYVVTPYVINAPVAFLALDPLVGLTTRIYGWLKPDEACRCHPRGEIYSFRMASVRLRDILGTDVNPQTPGSSKLSLTYTSQAASSVKYRYHLLRIG
jgi:hypothetical protein